ncbi:succinyl-CoA ligase (ADP-forming) subunit beta [Candidatus Uzinura diaspidicola str. ASNER]|uniref:Succinate--CoA ligase [ADP-forming] subunit beta n=1 Tax=Candidatus Uzinura diaspidicola str. ASNER TaxID=1133592 RepID=L7VN29_9FLAO|nr:succinyl-CoA ligase (ADP-forming) subunit beta [Candidatus Uzinura diaspidicola str. ASNER]
MNLYEYQGKNIFCSSRIRTPVGIVVETPEQAVIAAEKIYKNTFSNIWVVKAQIYAGGRSKAGGVKIAKSLEEISKISAEILGTYLITIQTSKKGNLVRKVLIEQYVYFLGEEDEIPKEYYLSILIDRSKGKTVIIYSLKGGIDIEEVAKNEQEKIFVEEIDPLFGIQKFQIRKIAFNLALESKQFKDFITSLYKAYKYSDASLVEINPLLKTSNNKIMAVDAKVALDANAFYRHMNYSYLHNLEEDPLEVVANDSGLNFVKLYGNVGCMVNGAGLAMATMDIIKFSGGNPANFLDIGGTADSKRVEKAIRLLIKDENVSAIFINIFGGIVRCDLVAEGILLAYQGGLNLHVPLIVRLHGTNYKKAKKILDEIGLKVITVVTLKQAAEKINEVLSLS